MVQCASGKPISMVIVTKIYLETFAKTGQSIIGAFVWLAGT